MAPPVAERVARLMIAGKPIPRAWSNIKPAILQPIMADVVEAVSKGDEVYLKSVALMNRTKQAAHLMGKISVARDRGQDIPESWIAALKAVCEPKRFKKWQKRFNRRDKAKKRAKKVSPRPPRIKITRTVEYTYDEADNARLDAFYQTDEWHMMRYEALRLHGGRCQCCGASPEDGKTVLNVDHIKPIRVYWDLRLDIDNLQVLCGGCNKGKGARHADDWRPETVS